MPPVGVSTNTGWWSASVRNSSKWWEPAGAGVVAGPPDPPQRKTFGYELARVAFPEHPGKVGLDQAGRDGIDPHRWSQLEGQLPRQVDHRCFGHVVVPDDAIGLHGAD